MGIFQGIKDDYEKAIARGKEIEAEAKSDVTAAVAEVKAVAGRVEEVFETLATQALNEVEKFTQAAEDALAALLDYEEKLKADIADKSGALAKVQDTIAKVQAVQPVVAATTTGTPSAATPQAS